MHTRFGDHVFAQVVGADVHQLDRVERAAAQVWRSGGVRGAPAEAEVGLLVGRSAGPVMTPVAEPGCQVSAAATSSKCPSLARKALPAPFSSAGQP